MRRNRIVGYHGRHHFPNFLSQLCILSTAQNAQLSKQDTSHKPYPTQFCAWQHAEQNVNLRWTWAVGISTENSFSGTEFATTRRPTHPTNRLWSERVKTVRTPSPKDDPIQIVHAETNMGITPSKVGQMGNQTWDPRHENTTTRANTSR